MSELSVVIPAHNEAVLIEPLLRALADDSGLQVVVVANGCTDNTAAVARAISSRVQVAEIDEASKIAALNRGDEVATAWPRVYLDADVTVSAQDLRALGESLETEGKLVGSPQMRVDLAGCTWPVRAYYKIWELTDYRRSGHVGSGVYALSQEGRARFGRFPDIIADDLFAQTRFAPQERLGPIDAWFTVHAPYTFGALLHRGERIALGNLQLKSEEDTPASSGAASLVRRVLPHPSLWVPFLVYCVGYAIPRRRAGRLWRAGKVPGWNRDDSTRVVR